MMWNRSAARSLHGPDLEENTVRIGFRRSLAIAAALPVIGVLTAPAAHAGYPLDCDKQTVLLVSYDQTGEDIEYTSYDGDTPIQDAIDDATGTRAGSGVGDTVIVCPGEFHENVHVPLVEETNDEGDAVDDNANISIRSWKGPHDTTIVGDLSAADAVVDIDANGVHFGGAGLGFTILAEGLPDEPTVAGIQVGTPMPPNMDQDDDQEIAECLPEDDPLDCPDEERPALTPINVTVAGNEIGELVPPSFDGTVAGIAVNNTNNTLTFRNLVKELAVGPGARAYGIRYGDTNSNVRVLQNAVEKLEQSGGECGDSTSLESPTVGAVGISAEDEALDALFFNNLVKKVEATCTAVGMYSDAWGGLENDRNGQQIPIVTDAINNKIKDVEGAESAGIVLAVIEETERTYGDNPTGQGDETAPPSSFRVSTNDFDDTGIGVAVFQQLSTYTYVEQNNFDHNEVGVRNVGNTNLDATNNWWGCDEGPLSAKKKCATVENFDGVGGMGTTHVHPWLKHKVDHAGAHAGDHAGHH